MSSFQHRYELANAMDQIRPQQLDANVLFGPVNSISQSKFIAENNIRFFISIGFKCSQVVEYCKSIPIDDYLMIIMEDGLETENESSDIKEFRIKHSAKLQHVLKMNNGTNSSQGCGYLTPQPEPVPALYRPLAEYSSNVIRSSCVTALENFNDLLSIFRRSQLGNVLVYSANGNDERLTKFLVSSVIKSNVHISLLEAFHHVKSLRATVEVEQDASLFWSSSLVAYHERVRAKELFWGIGSPTTASYSQQQFGSKPIAKRRNDSPSCDEEQMNKYLSPEPSHPTRAICTPKKRFIPGASLMD
ncbi:HEL219Wp [Eremothecium sinecaudum]|uniref:HEL219Wp n=1 Tax=Eremothecium sinecaudum TaxID=45286 RepID=A0A109UXA9_9SACH|nr:HEL219Wp [Eremothecium sinecaudum]AMD21062.1 HEL219Wp [Eremothecium sinecaudum]